jgi:ribose transport system permease protein
MVGESENLNLELGPNLGNRLVRRYSVLFALAALLIAMAFGSPSFLSLKNFVNVLSQWSPVGIMAVGTTYVVLAGGFDLSVASGFRLCAVIAAAVAANGVPPALCFLAAIAVGTMIGLVNGLIVVGLRVNPFIATLGSGFMLFGAPHMIVESPYIIVRQPGYGVLGTGSWLGMPYAGLCLILFLVLGGIVLSRTSYGQWVYAVGGNPAVSRLFGIRVGLVRASTYMISGFCMGAAAAISFSQLSYSASDQDPALIFDVIVAVVVGGTSLRGGFGSAWRTAGGLAILATLQNGLNLLQVNTVAQYIVKGFIIIGAIALDEWTRRVGASFDRSARVPRSVRLRN